MSVVELTDKLCQSAKVQVGRYANYFDTIVTGLCLKASAGGAKTFFLVYSRPDGKRAWMKLGRYPEVTLAKARQRAREGRGSVGDGKDPIAEKKAEAAGQTVAELVENYIARHASTKRSGEAIARRLRKNVKDVIGAVKLNELHRRDLTKCIDAVVDRGAATEANRVFEDVRAMVRWARGRGDLDDNLTEGMKRPTETAPRERVLPAEEIKAVWAGLASAGMRESTRRILRLCLITGQRVGEVAGMARAELDLEHGLWTIPAERSKNKHQHVVPLSDMAVAILRDQLAEADKLAKRKDRKPSQYVFPGPGDRAATTGHAIAKAVKREETKAGTIMGAPLWTPHDLRRSAATHMEELGVSPFIVGHVLNHATVTKASITSKVYARYDYAREKREALDLWADRLAAIIAGKGEVVSLRGAA